MRLGLQFQLNSNNASGFGGFDGVLYHSCWDTISKDVCKVVQQFFMHNWILHGMNNNVVSLIPKIQRVDVIKDFRPIVVADFIIKIISKILTDRLSRISSKLISPN